MIIFGFRKRLLKIVHDQVREAVETFSPEGIIRTDAAERESISTFNDPPFGHIVPQGCHVESHSDKPPGRG